MGWVERRGKKFRLSFRYGGKMFRHSLGTENQKEADESLALVERNLRLLEEGILELPPGGDLPLFLLSSGKRKAKPKVAAVLTLADLSEQYLGAQVGAQEGNSLATARIHAEHLKKTFGDRFPVQALTTSDLQRHVDRRATAKGRHGRTLSPTTIKKEISSFSGMWSWGVRMGLLINAFPNRGLVYGKTTEKPPFQTRAEIEEQLNRGGLSDAEKDELWDSLFLTLEEIAEVLEYVRKNARHDWIYPMFCFAAHTGARRSEILRSRISDFDFQSKTALIREKKRVKGKRTTRRVPLSAFFARTMREWFDVHPGGVHSISQELKIAWSKKSRPDFVPVTIDESNHHFQQTLAGSKWEVIRGWHVFRHSFASNCAARGIDQRIINEWLGHQTEEMVKRYRHLLHDVSSRAMHSVFEG